MRRSPLILATSLLLSAACLWPAGVALAQVETPITVRVRAADAKFVGTSMGGAHVVIRDRATGDIIANGITHGGTGDTDRIMKQNHDRNSILSDDDTAKLDISVDLAHPMPVTITATGPMIAQGAAVTTSTDMLLIPGKDYSKGDGIVLELPGFSVDIATPVAGTTMAHDPEALIDIVANVAKLCGCAIAKDSPWPPENYDVELQLYKESAFAGTVKMTPVGKTPGEFIAKAKMPEPGIYQIYVTAFDPMTKEGGMASSSLILTEASKKK